MVPTFRNACSGYWSISPLRIILKPRMISAQGTITPGRPVNCSATKKGLREEALRRGGRGNYELVIVGELVDTEDGDDVLELVVLLEQLLDSLAVLVVVLADDVGVEDARGRFQRVHCRVDTELGNLTQSTVVASRKLNVVAGAGSVVIGWHVDGLNRGDRTLFC